MIRSPKIIFLGIFILQFLLTINSPSYPQEKVEVFFDGEVDKMGIPLGWKLKERTGAAEIKIIEEDGEKVAYFKSVAASFSLEKPLSIDPKRYPIISWKWKVIKFPMGGDVRVKGKNDQASQLLVVFKGRKTLGYIWDTIAPEGTIMDESIGWPINLKIKVITVKSGVSDINQWISFKRNLAEDYKRLYQENPLWIEGLRIQINSQYTKTITEALFGKIIFSSGPR